nr:hypothetical protein [uncultured Flavobacterium sp.]
MKLTTEQIQAVNNALLGARIVHQDIRVELTDHIASVLEKEGSDFEQSLSVYISENKKELRRLNRKFMRIGAGKGLKLLFSNLFSLKILLVFLGIVSFGKLIQQFAASDDMGIFMFLIFTVCSCIGCYPGLRSIILKKENFSFDLGIGMIPSLIFYPSILMQKWIPNPDFLIVYYAVVGAFSIDIYVTTKSLHNKYRRLYHG